MQRPLTLALLLLCSSSYAASSRFGIELESEKDRQTHIINNAVTFIPGWDVENAFFNRVELLLEGNQDNQGDGGRATENKLFLRLRHDGELSDSLGYYLRGGIGRAFNSSHNYNYGYVEPGVEYKMAEHWAWTVAYRAIDALDNTTGQHVGKTITGPSYDMDEYNEFELRHSNGSGDKALSSWMFEYVHKW